MKAKMNRMDPDVSFLSNKVRGDVLVDNPDGTIDGSDDLGLVYGRGPNGVTRDYGAISGKGKTLEVNTASARVKLKDGPA